MAEGIINSASVTGRAVIAGDIILDAPLLIGGGEQEYSRESDEDICVLKGKDGPFIPGTSLCGVLRDFMRLYSGVKTQDKDDLQEDSIVTMLFGDMDNSQSMISIDDISLSDAKIIIRDGVHIDGITGVGVEGERYDYEAVERGARGKFRIAITRRKCHEADWYDIYKNLILLREKLATGVSLGANTAKGFGKVHAENIRSAFYDYYKKEDVLTWLRHEEPHLDEASNHMVENNSISLEMPQELVVEADFALRTSVIIRDYKRKKKIDAEKNDKEYDAVSMMSGNDYVLPGTSLKGVLRHHVEHILRKLNLDDSLLQELMGFSSRKEKQKSRFQIDESLLGKNVKPYGQPRVRVDRFTGGAMDTALFINEPLWQKDDRAAFRICFRIKNAQPEEIGLALLLLRDMWQGKVAVGGEKSIGRGTLRGLGAVIRYRGQSSENSACEDIYRLDENGRIIEGNGDKLQEYVDALLQKKKEMVK